MVLSPQPSSANQLAGGIASPKGGNGGILQKLQSPAIQEYNNRGMMEDKENGPEALVFPDSMEDKEDEVISDSPPKRLAEEDPEGSPESTHKKARTNDFEATEATISPPKTGCSKSVDDLLADLAKAKSALLESKDTLKVLKEHQQKLADNGAEMDARVQAFDQELTKLKQTHAENGKELEKVLEIREKANQKFMAAEETLRKITEKQEEDSSKEESNAAASNEATSFVAEEIVAKEEEDTTETAIVGPSPSDEKEDTVEADDLVEAATVDDEDISEDKVVEPEEAEAESPEKAAEPEAEDEVEAKDMPSPSSSEKDDCASPSGVLDVVAQDSMESTPFDEDDSEIEEAKEALSFLDGKADSFDESTAAPTLSSAGATIDDTLALELQNTDGGDSDSDDDLLM